MTDPAIIEAAARALRDAGIHAQTNRALTKEILAAVTPLIEATALERAAKVAEEWEHFYVDSYCTPDECGDIADAIRALSKSEAK